MANLRVRSLQSWTIIATLVLSTMVAARAHAIAVIPEPQPNASGGTVQSGSTVSSVTSVAGSTVSQTTTGSWSVEATGTGGSLSTGYDYKGFASTYGSGSYETNDILNATITSSPELADSGSYSFSTDLVLSGTVVPGSTSSGSGVFSAANWNSGTLDLVNTATPSSVFAIASGSYQVEQVINITFANVSGGQTITVDLPDTSSVTAVPEPASIVLLCSSLGAIGLATAWRRRKRSA